MKARALSLVSLAGLALWGCGGSSGGGGNSATNRLIFIADEAQGVNATFANAATPDGRFVVGTARTTNGGGFPFRWSERGGLENLGNLGSGICSANAISDDGRTVVGECEVNGEQAPVVWNARGGAAALLLPAGSVGGAATGVAADGQTVVGYAQGREGEGEESLSVRWRSGSGPEVIFPGQANGITADGAFVIGSVPQDGEENDLGYRWSSPGYFTTFGEGATPLVNALAVDADGGTIAGDAGTGGADIPAFWSAEAGVTIMAGSIGTAALTVTRDGTVFGGGAEDPGLAFLYDFRHGLRSLTEILQNYDRQYGTMFESQFINAGIGPGNVIRISEDRRTVVGTGYPAEEGSPRAFVLKTRDLTQFNY